MNQNSGRYQWLNEVLRIEMEDNPIVPTSLYHPGSGRAKTTTRRVVWDAVIDLILFVNCELH